MEMLIYLMARDVHINKHYDFALWRTLFRKTAARWRNDWNANGKNWPQNAMPPRQAPRHASHCDSRPRRPRWRNAQVPHCRVVFRGKPTAGETSHSRSYVCNAIFKWSAHLWQNTFTKWPVCRVNAIQLPYTYSFAGCPSYLKKKKQKKREKD